jgi:hypothetical protein
MSVFQSFVQPVDKQSANKASKQTADKQPNSHQTIIRDRLKLATVVGSNFEIQLRSKVEERRVKFNHPQSVSITRANQHNMRQREQDNIRRREEVELHVSSRAGQHQQPTQTAINIHAQQAFNSESPQTVDYQSEQIVDPSQSKQYL